MIWHKDNETGGLSNLVLVNAAVQFRTVLGTLSACAMLRPEFNQTQWRMTHSGTARLITNARTSLLVPYSFMIRGN